MPSYTYLIGWSTQNVWYYGARYSKKADPRDLWRTYFTSSKYVKDARKLFGEPDIISVRRIFDAGEKAVAWEAKVLRRMNCMADSKWLNKNIAGHFSTTVSVSNPLKGKSYADVYGIDTANSWKNNIGVGSKKWWDSEEGAVAKQKLSSRSVGNKHTLGKEPPNKIKETFEFCCPVCAKRDIRRKLGGKRIKQTCGSKSCAAILSQRKKGYISH